MTVATLPGEAALNSHAAGTRETQLTEALVEYRALLEAGQAPDRATFLADRPDIADSLADCLAGLELVHAVAPQLSRHAHRSPIVQQGEDTSFAEPLGDFKIIRELGRGGMGVVYEAEQMSLGRRVALKVLPFASTLDARQLQRFKNEAQAAASLHHTNIVPVFATGVERGVHFYAMQYIEGRTLAQAIDELRRTILGQATPDEKTTAYVAGQEVRETRAAKRDATVTRSKSSKRKLPAEHYQRVAELGIQAAEALDYAHQMGIVHRDVKPANLMIDQSPIGNEKSAIRLWVTDFGLAQFGNDTKLTMTGDLLGTLRYMSPEQALAQRVVIDHRTDVYSLGATLYELLTLEPVFDGADRQAVLRQIAFEDPRSPRKIDGRIPVELEIILLKALEKDPLQRYATAKELADDLRRYVLHEPIKAKRTTLLGKARKWVRRRPGLVRAAMVMLTLGVIGLGLSTWLIWLEKEKVETAEKQARGETEKAETEAAIAKAVRDFLVNDLLAEAAPEKNPRNKKVTVEEVLGRAAARVAAKFDKQPLIEAAIRHTIGETYRAMGDYAAAQPHLERALEVRRGVLGDEHPDTLTSMNSLAWLYHRQGQHGKAEPLFVKALETRRGVLGDEHPDTLFSMSCLAVLYLDQHQYAKAEPLVLKTLEADHRILGDEHSETLANMGNLATIFGHQGQFAKAESLRIKSLEGYRLTLGEEHPETIISMQNLAYLYGSNGQFAKAEQLYDKVLEVGNRVLGEEHPHTVFSMINLAQLYESQGKYGQAEPLYDRTLEVSRRVLGKEHPHTLIIMNSLGMLHWKHGQHTKAESTFRELLETRRRVSGPDHPDALRAMSNLAAQYEAQRLYEKAEALKLEVFESNRRLLGESSPSTLESMNNLASLYANQDLNDKAEPLFLKCLEEKRRRLGNDHPSSLRTLNNLATVYWKRGQFGKAAQLQSELLGTYSRLSGPEHSDTITAMFNLAGCCQELGDFKKAESLFIDSLDLMRRVQGGDPNTIRSTGNLAWLYKTQGRFDKAEPLMLKRLADSRKVLGNEHRDTLDAMNGSAWLFVASGQFIKAEALMRECLPASEKVQPDDWTTFNTKSLLGGALLGQHQYVEAEPLLLGGYEGMKVREGRMPAVSKVFLTEALERLVQLYEATGKADDAAKWRKELEERKASKNAQQSP